MRWLARLRAVLNALALHPCIQHFSPFLGPPPLLHIFRENPPRAQIQTTAFVALTSTSTLAAMFA
jgi:hypothetical protein